MNTVADTKELRIKEMRVTDDQIIATLRDGRTVSVPLAWSWRLAEATPEQRAHFEFIGDGLGVHWPEIDEDLSAEGMLSGAPARRPKRQSASAAQRVVEIEQDVFIALFQYANALHEPVNRVASKILQEKLRTVANNNIEQS